MLFRSVRLLRDNLHPSGGNNDAIRTSLVELLLLAKKCAENKKPGKDYRIDVMDYIYEEMHEAMTNRGTLPYAPYIMILIKERLEPDDLSNDCTEIHKVKKPYKLKSKGKTAPAASGFMQDARATGGRATRTPTVSLPREIKKLS